MALGDKSASAIVAQMLDSYGLTFSRATVNRWVGLMSEDPSNDALINEEIRASPEYKERFAGMQQRIDNGYSPISAIEYIELESGYKATMRAMGMPATFYDDPDDFREFIVNDVAVPELEQRIARGYVAAQQASPAVRQSLQEFYGIQNTDAALAAYYLDPERALPAIEREFQSAQISGAAKQTDFGDLDKQHAERLAALGVQEAQARQEFSDLARQQGLFDTNLGRGQDFTVEDQLAAAFEGNADVQRRMNRQREQRLSEFAGSSKAGIGRKGVTGLQDTTG